MGWQEELRAKRAETERWMRQRETDLRRAAAGAEARGRQVYAHAIKTGQQVLARTPAEIRALGTAAARGQLPVALGRVIGEGAAGVVKQPRPKAAPAAKAPSAVGEKLRAGISGAVDEASFGLADHALAAANAVGGAIRSGESGRLLRDYRASMDEKRADDAFDAANHGTARNVGRAVGFAGSVAAMGAPGLARAAVAAIPRGRVAAQVIEHGLRYAPDARGLTTMMAAGGAGAGAVDQVVGDTLTGRRSTVGDVVSGAVGGGIGGAATRVGGPVIGGAAGGVATSMLGDIANGRALSLDDAYEAGRLSAALGGVGDELAHEWIRELGSNAKGKVGDRLSALKAIARGERVVEQQRRVYLNPEGEPPAYTVADKISVPRGLAETPENLRIGESKLGPYASLTPRQEQALRLFGDRYVVDFWRHSDIGNIGGTALSPLGNSTRESSELR